MSFPGKGGGHLRGPSRGFLPLWGWGRGRDGRYPARPVKALEAAVLGCVKSGNLPPLMYNRELTANKVGFCLYTLVPFELFCKSCRGEWREMFACVARVCLTHTCTHCHVHRHVRACTQKHRQPHVHTCRWTHLHTCTPSVYTRRHTHADTRRLWVTCSNRVSSTEFYGGALQLQQRPGPGVS